MLGNVRFDGAKVLGFGQVVSIVSDAEELRAVLLHALADGSSHVYQLGADESFAHA